jgi:hypothetical protein
MSIFIDIETIPTQRPDEIARIAAKAIAHNATLAKPKSDEEVRALADEAHRKTALDGAWAEVVCICIGLIDDDAAPSSTRRWCYGRSQEPGPPPWRECGDELDMIRDFFIWLEFVKRPFTLIGHNVVGFDLPILRQRAMVHGLEAPACIRRTMKPWDAVEVDTMLMWTGGAPGKTISLDNLCRALGVDGKGNGLDGSKVYDAWLAGRHDEIAAYCADDVRRTMAVYERMRGSHGP